MTTDVGRLTAALADRYRIERELGQGGMATVYLAHDLRHERDVAIKVLHEDLGASLGPERFLAEIKTTAKLQHPHILPLLDSGEVAGLLFYVMPFVAGETLRQRLTRDTQLSIGDAVRIAREVADALDAAHGHGIVHRDIKPENILLQSGHALVADFGIALAVQHAGGQRMTQTGLSLGTPQYMSPEQAMGDKTVDHRSDIYALGAVTYEMLTGDPPFTGSSIQAIVAKVLSAEPERPTLMRKTIPPGVEAAVLTALAKLPADRFASARDFAEALSRPGFTHDTAAFRPARRGRPWVVRAAGIAVGAVVVAAAAVWGWSRDRIAVPLANVRVLIDFPEGRAPIFQPGGGFALSADGSRLAYMGGGRRAGGGDTWRLWIRPLDRLTADSIPGSEGAHSPVWSPGGDSVAFVIGGELRVFSTLAGGGVATIRRGSEIGYGLSWSRERGILFATTAGLHRVDISGKEETLLRRDRGASIFSWPYWVPGGRTAIVTVEDESLRRNRVVLARLDGSARLDTLVEGFNGQALPNGDLLWADATGAIYAAPLDLEQGRLRGGRTQLLSGILTEPGLELRLSVSQQGAMAYALASAVQARSHFVVVNRRSGERTILPSPPDARVFPDLRLSPDATRLAASGTRGVNQQIWIYQLPTARVEGFALDGISYNVAWTPDGDRLTYCSTVPSFGVYSRPVDKRSSASRLGAFSGCPRSWTPDGTTLLLDGGPLGMAALTPPDTVARPLGDRGDREFGPAVSPDGRWLAYAAVKSGTADVWVRGFRVAGGPWQVSQGGAFDPVWSRDGRSLFFRTDSAIAVVDVAAGTTFRVGAPQRVTAASSSVGAIYGQSFDVFPGGEQLVLFESGSGASVEHLILETNLLGRTRRP